MRLRISHKLFIALLVVNLVLVVAMVGLIRHSFRSGFLDYLNRVEATRLETLASDLADYYRQAGSWDALAREPRQWARLVVGVDREGDGGPAPDRRPPGRRPPPGSLLFRLALTTPAGGLIAGNPRAAGAAQTQTVVVDGRTVALLHLLPLRSFGRRINSQFAEHQIRRAYVIGGLVLVFAFALALILSRQLVSPVRRLAAAMRDLAAGDYERRVESTSRDEIGQLAVDFNALAQTLQRNEELRRGALADISHELRTPLAVLRGELQAIEDGVRQPGPKELASLSAEVARLTKLVDDLYQLSLSDIGALDYRKRDVDAGALLGDTAAMFEQRFTARGLRLSQDLEPARGVRLFADPERLQQLFANLFENSLRYTDSPGTLSVRASREDADHLHIVFEDSAPGVLAEDHERLFERLYRGEVSRSRETGGAGLGLAICRNIVTAHGGSIRAGDSALGGVRIDIHLPLRD